MISGKIENGLFWIAEATKMELETIHNALCVQVPGAEHTSLFKQGKWDGYRKFFNWHYKSFARGLLGFVSRKTGYQFDILNSDCFNEDIPYAHFRVKGHYELRDFQIDTIKKLLRNHGGVAHLATNAGKTACIAGVCLALQKKGYKVAILEKMENLLDQVKEEVESCTGLELGEYSAKEKTLEDVTILMVPSIGTAMKRIYNGEGSDLDNELFSWLKGVTAFAIDECIECNTKILTSSGYVKIKDLTIINPLYILSYNERRSILEWKLWNNCVLKGKKQLVELHLENGSSIKCTEDHLIFVGGLWKKAGEIKNGDCALVVVREFYLKMFYRRIASICLNMIKDRVTGIWKSQKMREALY